MNLDDLHYFKSIDSQNHLRHIDALPNQVRAGWELGQALTLPEAYRNAAHIVMAGMGGSGIGGELAQVLVARESSLPIMVVRGYVPPAFVGPDTLVVGLSHSGNTEETLSACEAALARGAMLLAITGGGRLAALAEAHGAPVWQFEHDGPPRSAVGYTFMLTLAALAKLGAVGNQAENVAEAVSALRAQQESLGAESPVTRNPAKRMAGQLMDRIVAVFASDFLAPVARRWNGQITEIAKAWAQFVELPEADHNQVVGTMYPEALVSKFMVLFLRSTYNHPQNKRRSEVTREIYMTAGFNTDAIEATGQSPLAHLLTALHYGDYVAYYLAMCYGVDPTPTPQIDYLKEQLARA